MKTIHDHSLGILEGQAVEPPQDFRDTIPGIGIHNFVEQIGNFPKHIIDSVILFDVHFFQITIDDKQLLRGEQRIPADL